MFKYYFMVLGVACWNFVFFFSWQLFACFCLQSSSQLSATRSTNTYNENISFLLLAENKKFNIGIPGQSDFYFIKNKQTKHSSPPASD